MKNVFKQVIMSILLITIAATFISCSDKSKNNNDKDVEGSITVWSWNNELITSGIIDKFNKEYPNITVNLVTIPNDNNAYSIKLFSTLKSGIRTPDVFLSEAANVKRMCNTDYYENLSEGDYNLEEVTENMVPYTVDLGRNDSDGSLRALTWQATPGGFFYRKSLAKQYLGTDDPKEIQNMISTYDGLIATGKRLNEASNNKVKLLASYEELYNVISGSRSSGWVKDGKLVIDPEMYKYLDYAMEIKNNNLQLDAAQWTQKWTDSMAEGSVLGYMLPTWGVNAVLLANAPETKGDWTFVQAPTPYYWGGSWLGIYKGSKNKDLSYLFVKYVTTNSDFLKSHAKETGDFVNNTTVQNEISNSEDGNNDFVSGQNLYSSYLQLVPYIKGDTVTEYDEKIKALWYDNALLYISSRITRDEMINRFKTSVKEEFPEVDIN